MSNFIKKTYFITLLFLFTSMSLIIQEDNIHLKKENFENTLYSDEITNDYIQGNSYLNISNPLHSNSLLNATWYSTITIDQSYGTDILPNQSIGLRKQIDQYIGNSDDYINDSEVMEFNEYINISRSWNDAELGGCCIIDYTPFYSEISNLIVIKSPITGPVNMTNSTWGWEESANITGYTDNRITRVLDLPRFGSLIEEIPLHVSLPGNWEFRYSAMSEIISGTPTNFIVNRSQAPVSSNIRITLSENIPPVVVATRSQNPSSFIALNNSYTYSGICNDGPLETPVMEWKIIKDGNLIFSVENPWFNFKPLDYTFMHGDMASISFKCTDSHNISSLWSENITIDALAPKWEGEIYFNFRGTNNQLNISDSHFFMPSGSQLNLDIMGIDENGQDVSIELYTNMSESWTQYQKNEGNFSFYVTQGDNINGLHLNITDRHLEKDLRNIEMILIIMDQAGNFVKKEFNLIINDGNSPTVLMDIMANNSIVRLDNSAREGNYIKLIFSNSYDDIDSIENTTWRILLDDEIIIKDSPWSSEIEKLNLSQLNVGSYEITIIVTDSKGNDKIETFPLMIFPKKGVDLEVISYSIIEDSQNTGNALLILEMKNNYNDDVFARACFENSCSRFVNFPGASADSSTVVFLEFEFEVPSTDLINFTIDWDSNSANDNGNFIIQYDFNQSDENSNNSLFILISIVLILLFVTIRNKIKHS